MLKRIQGFRGTTEARMFSAALEVRLNGADLFPKNTVAKTLDLKLNTPKAKAPSLNA